MCGIIGFVGRVQEGQWGQTYSLLRHLFIAAEHRGRDATGLVAVTDPSGGKRAGKVVVAKEPVEASRFVETDPAFLNLRRRRCSACVGHVRLATHGDPLDPRNNHPHVGRHLSLVHNGIVSNHRELADRHALRLKSQCDSECLLRIVEASDHPALGLDRCLREVKGSMAVALIDPRESLVWVARNTGRPLWLAKMRKDRRYFFASTASILLSAFRRVLGPHAAGRLDYLAPVAEGSPLALSPSGRLIAPLLDQV